MWRDRLRGWRAFAFIYFILIALFECAEALANVFGFFDLAALAGLSGITPDRQFQRLVSLSILSTAITISSVATAFSIRTNKPWTVRAGIITGIVLLLYMVYQVLSALFILTVNNYAVLGAGCTFGIFGLFGVWLVRRAEHETSDLA